MDINYVKELQDSINSSNNEFVQEQYVLDHASAAAKQALYYAHGNTEKNEINYRTANAEESKAHSLNDKSVKAVNLATNAVTAAKQALVESGKATSNISTAAANMQIAANAITKLSSDVAGILAVATAADHGSMIQESVEKAHEKIKLAAKLAEEVSLVSLQATIDAAQSTASTVVTDADLAQSSVNDLQKATASDYSNASAKTVAANEALTEASKEEKAAAGAYDIADKQDAAIGTSRDLINYVSNHNLVSFDMAAQKRLRKKDRNKDYKLFPVDASVGQSYTVQFRKFHQEGNIQNYNVVMVKYTEAHTFDVNVAKELNAGTYYQFQPKGYAGYSTTFFLLGTEQALIPYDPDALEQTEPSKASDYWHQDVPGIAVDYQGKPIEEGTYYVAFIYAEYTDEYEKEISSTDGYLSLMSEKFILKTPLHRVPKHIGDKNGKLSDNLVLHRPYFDSRNVAVQFEVYLKNFDPELMEYRIIMVEEDNVKANKINKRIDWAVDALDDATYNYNIQLQKLQEMKDLYNLLEIEFNTYQSTALSLEKQLVELESAMDSNENPAPSVVKSVALLTAQLTNIQTDLTTNQKEQTKLQKAIYGSNPKKVGGQSAIVDAARTKKKQAERLETLVSAKKISDFIFDEDLMATVSAANYTIAQPFPWDLVSAKAQQTEAAEKLRLSKTTLKNAIKENKAFSGDLTKAKTALETAQAQEVFALTALNTAEANLDKEEMKLLTSAFQSETNAKSKKAENTDSTDDSSYQKAVDKVKLKRKEYKVAQDTLSAAELELERIHDQQEANTTSMAKLLSEFVKAVYNKNRADLILGLAKENVETKKKTQKDIKDGTEKVLFYTEIGEDATDNYGEPLQFNDATVWRYALKDLNKKIEAADSSDSGIENFLKEFDQETSSTIVAEDKIAYQAVVLTAMAATAEGVEDTDQYIARASKYSDPVALVGPVD